MSSPYLGEIRLFGFPFNPRGCALCQGQTIAIQQNAALFSLLGTYFGGNGVQTFQLPNLASRLAVGQGTGPGLSAYTIGQIAGVEDVSILANNMPLHNHPLTGAPSVTTTVSVGATDGPGSLPKPVGNVLAKGVDAGNGNSLNNYAAPPSTGALGGATAASTATLGNLAVGMAGGNVPVKILPPLLAINYCINTVGLFPSRN
jgi:microcystin-dependent protein